MPDRRASALARIWILPRDLGWGVAGLCIGAVTGYQFLPLLSFNTLRAIGSVVGLRLTEADMFWFPAVLGGVVGAIAAVGYGRISDARSARRDAARADAARIHGLQVSPTLDAEIGAELQQRFSFNVQMGNAMRREVSGIAITAGNLTIAPRAAGFDVSNQRASEQTGAFIKTAGISFPQFTLQPQHPALKMLSAMTGIAEIHFPAQPEFSGHYHLSGVHRENVRRLFDDEELLKYLASRPGLHVQSAPDAVLIYRPGTEVGIEQIDDFLAEWVELFRRLEASARKLQAARAAGLIPKIDPHAEAKQLTGSMGKQLRARIVTREDVEAFVRQPVPRKLPGNIRHYCDARAPTGLIAIGALFLLGGAVFAALFAMADKTSWTVLPSLFVLGGGAMVFFSGRARLRVEHLLRRGELSVGTFVSLEPTNAFASDGQVWRALVQLRGAGTVSLGELSLSGFAAERARMLAAQKKPAAVLCHRSHPTQFVLVEELITVSPEFDA